MQTLKRIPRSAPLVLALVAALLIGATSGAVAAKKITGKDIALNTITGANVKAGSLAASDLSAAAKATLRGARGPAGQQGPKGDPGPQGDPGQPGAGLDDFAYYQNVATAVPANTNDFIVEGDCPTGQSIISAFAYWATDNSPLQVSVGFIDDTTMAAVAYSPGISTTQNATIQFSCATVPLPARAERRALPSLR
ncbi:hypothetical protein GCM10023340_33280 [Nocardioides marinquilinus]|uniref:Collagen-like protein n=1 Tax=Nocardioides marinquilinus TaxID=1210400 RepID=A0ABP9PV12_9ACTN